MSDKLSWIFDMSGLRPEIEFSNTFTLIKTGMRFKQVSTDIHRFWCKKYYYHFDLIIKVKYFQKNTVRSG